MGGPFQVGDRVRISDRPERRHNRTPRYVRGHIGTVARLCPAFGQPELLAYAGDGRPAQTVYRVRLKQTDLWPAYGGAPDDHLEIEIFGHWLEPAAQGA